MLLDYDLGQELQTATEDFNAIKMMNKAPAWQLKGIVSQISLKLL